MNSQTDECRETNFTLSEIMETIEETFNSIDDNQNEACGILDSNCFDMKVEMEKFDSKKMVFKNQNCTVEYTHTKTCGEIQSEEQTGKIIKGTYSAGII